MIVKNGDYKICDLSPNQNLTVNTENLDYSFKIKFRGETVVADNTIKVKQSQYSPSLKFEEVVEVFIETVEDEDKEVSFEVVNEEE